MDRSGVTPCSVPRVLFSGRFKERKREKESACEGEGGRGNEKKKSVLRAPLHAPQFPMLSTFSGPYWPEKFAKVCKLPILALAGGPTVCRKGTLCLPG